MDRVAASGGKNAAKIDALYLAALARKPSAKEVSAANKLMVDRKGDAMRPSRTSGGPCSTRTNSSSTTDPTYRSDQPGVSHVSRAQRHVPPALHRATSRGSRRRWRAPATAFTNSILANATDMKKRHKSAILLWMGGGPSTMDIWDLKPGAATGGPFRADLDLRRRRRDLRAHAAHGQADAPHVDRAVDEHA